MPNTHINLDSFLQDGLETPQCPICQEEFTAASQRFTSISNSNSQTMVRILACGHQFHLGCLQPWVTQHNTCPICRQRLYEFRETRHRRHNPNLGVVRAAHSILMNALYQRQRYLMERPDAGTTPSTYASWTEYHGYSAW